MGRAKPCKQCHTDRHLRWKTDDETIWWIACEGCGAIGDRGVTQRAAGEAWNAAQVDEKAEKFKEFFGIVEGQLPPVGLPQALYTASELHLWPDNVTSVGTDQAMMIWKIVNDLMGTKKFPDNLKM
jgi:hypothetical protein